MTELDKIRNEYYKLCTWKILKYVDKIWELAHNASLIFGDLPIIRKYEGLASTFRQKGLNGIAQAIKLLIREDNYENVPKLKKRKKMISKEVAQFLGVAGKHITSVQDIIDILSNIKWNYRGRTLEPKDIPFTMTGKDGRMIIYDMTPTFLFGVFKPSCTLDLKYLFTEYAPKALQEEYKKLERENKDLKNKLDKCKSVLNELD